jgi:hypothetical protein
MTTTKYRQQRITCELLLENSAKNVRPPIRQPTVAITASALPCQSCEISFVRQSDVANKTIHSTGFMRPVLAFDRYLLLLTGGSPRGDAIPGPTAFTFG